MGRAIVNTAYKNDDITIVGGIAPVGRSYIGTDLGILCGIGKEINAKTYGDISEVIHQSDVIVDCTMPDVTMSILEKCLEYNKRFITGTTGFKENELLKIKEAGKSIPLLLAANTSRLTHLFYSQLVNICRNIKGNVDIDIIDFHDNMKIDAPSGTAKEISRLIAKELNYELSTCCEYGRNGRDRRPKNTIAFNSIRSGGVPGSIKVIFGFEDENLEITLNVFNMNTFAKGIIDGCFYIMDKDKGLYNIEEVFCTGKN